MHLASVALEDRSDAGYQASYQSRDCTKVRTASTKRSGHSSCGICPQPSKTTSCTKEAGREGNQAQQQQCPASEQEALAARCRRAATHLCVWQQCGQAAGVGGRHQGIAAAVQDEHTDVVAADGRCQPLCLCQVALALQNRGRAMPGLMQRHQQLLSFPPAMLGHALKQQAAAQHSHLRWQRQ